MNMAKCAKNCQVPLSTTTANSFNSIENSNGKTLSPVTATANSNCNSDLLEMYECLSPECPNSPNVTMAGSPRGKKFIQCKTLHFRCCILKCHFSIFCKSLIHRLESSIVSRIHREIHR